jgi:hypothetical protein
MDIDDEDAYLYGDDEPTQTVPAAEAKPAPAPAKTGAI